MLPNEIIARLKPEVASQLFSYLFEHNKPLYKATIEALAKQRHLRGVFVERKPRLERFAWMQANLGRRANEGVAAHLLQIWLMQEHCALLCGFLDALGIEHAEDGTVSELPGAPDREQVVAAVETVLAKHDPAIVATYLHAFQAMDDKGGWPALGELLETDPRLQLAPPVE